MKTLSIVIPAYNEASTLDELLRRVVDVDLEECEKQIIVVNDGSTDATPDILRAWADKVMVHTHERNRGKGAAVRTGYEHAIGEYVVVQDADLELDPNDLRSMLKKARETNASAVFGSRILPMHEVERSRGVWYFALGGRTLTWLANILYGISITDEPTCYKMVRRDILQKLSLSANGFEFCPELTAKLARMDVEIHEVPIRYTPRTRSEGKKVKLRDWFIAVWTLLKHRI